VAQKAASAARASDTILRISGRDARKPYHSSYHWKSSSETQDRAEQNGEKKGADSLLKAGKMVFSDQATTLLQKYIEHRQPHFPFVIIPPEKHTSRLSGNNFLSSSCVP
jgi:hypothetical protein